MWQALISAMLTMYTHVYMFVPMCVMGKECMSILQSTLICFYVCCTSTVDVHARQCDDTAVSGQWQYTVY